MFIHELSTLAGTGMGTHVLSVKRKRWADVEREQLVADFEKLKADSATIAALKVKANTITKDELERLAVPALVFAVIAFLMIYQLNLGRRFLHSNAKTRALLQRRRHVARNRRILIVNELLRKRGEEKRPNEERKKKKFYLYIQTR